MSRSKSRGARFQHVWLVWIVQACLSAALLAATPAAYALDPSLAVVRVEEDWELSVGTPNERIAAPQVVCTISPRADVQSLYATFELNHQNLPEFVPGGLQLQVWNGETPLSSRKFPNANLLGLSGETVSWKQTMNLNDGVLTWEITGGHSSTWGDFGGQGYLKASVSTDLPNLNGYNPDVSVANSGVGFAANLVNHLVLKRVRLTTSDGQVLEDSTPRVVYSQDQP